MRKKLRNSITMLKLHIVQVFKLEESLEAYSSLFTHIHNVQWGKVKQIATASQWPMEDQVQVPTTNRVLMCVLFTQSVKCFVCVFCLVLFTVVIFFLLRNCSDWGNTWIFLIKYGRIWIDMFIIIDEHRYEKWLFLTI